MNNDPGCCYFIAGGVTLAAIRAYMEVVDEHFAAMRALATEWGFDPDRLFRTTGGGARVAGFSLPEGVTAIPDGFGRDRSTAGMMVPRDTRAGRAAAKRMREVPVPSVESVMTASGVEPVTFADHNGVHVARIGWEVIGEDVVVMLFADETGAPRNGVPADCQRILTSRYWQLREARDEAKAVEKAAAESESAR